MIQFLNCMCVTGKTDDKYLGDSTSPVCIRVDRIVEITRVCYDVVATRLGYTTVQDHENSTWTQLYVELGDKLHKYYLAHEPEDVIRAIAHLNHNSDITECLVDDMVKHA